MSQWYVKLMRATIVPVVAVVTAIPSGAGAQEQRPGWGISWYSGGSWFSHAYDSSFIHGIRASTPIGPTTAMFLEGAYTSTKEVPGPDCQNEFCSERDNPVSALVFGWGFMRDVLGARGSRRAVLSLGLELASVRWREDRGDDGLSDVTDYSWGLGALAAVRFEVTSNAELALEAGSLALPAGNDALYSVRMDWVHALRVGFSFRP